MRPQTARVGDYRSHRSEPPALIIGSFSFSNGRE